MGNTFQTLATQFSQSERYSCVIPTPLYRIITERLKTPYQIREAC